MLWEDMLEPEPRRLVVVLKSWKLLQWERVENKTSVGKVDEGVYRAPLVLGASRA